MNKTIPTTLSKFLWHFSKKYIYYLVGLVLVAIFWAISISLSPYAMKLIIDTVSSYESETESLFQAVKSPAILYILISIAYGAVFRMYDWLALKTFPLVKSLQVCLII